MKKKIEMEMETKKAIIVLDNAGGCTLILGKFQHSYNNMGQARHDAVAYEKNEDMSDWECNEIDEYPLDINTDEFANAERNGGYCVYSGVEAIDNDSEPWGENGKMFQAEGKK